MHLLGVFVQCPKVREMSVTQDGYNGHLLAIRFIEWSF